MDIGLELAQLRKKLEAVERASRLSHASLEDTALQVYDGEGSLRAILGVQSDGTTAVNVVNGPPPPTPSAPVVASVLGGVTAGWDGTFADGSTVPLDWARTEVHASTTATFTPDAGTLRTTIETAQGGTVVLATDTPVYVLLVARNTSGAASAPSAIVGPFGPEPVVAQDVVDGIVTTVKLADDAVTQAKIAAAAVDSTALGDGAVLAQKLADAAVQVGKIADNAVTGPAIAANAVTAGKINADAVTAREIAAGAVTASEVAAGAITTDKLTVTGGANLLTDPSFEGAYTAACVAGLSYASQDTTKGNGSPTSIKINAVSATAAYRSVQLTLLPTLPGEQLHLGADYYVSADWAGTEVDFQVRWETDTGTVLSYGKASATSPVREAWTRITGTFTAPAQATKARIRVESGNATAGTVWWDNATVRPVLAGTQIQDGAVTTPKIVAGSVQADQIATGAVAADKIAANAVTTAKLDALAVTADKLAANAIVAGKIAAGAVDATAIAADAITGKTITGGTITGTTVTGGLIQTASSGERLVLNESSTNSVRTYNSAGTLVANMDANGLGMRGSSGAVIRLNPGTTYPNMALYNAGNTNNATIQVAETNTGEANLEQFCGPFAANGYTDMAWRTFLTKDGAVMERLRLGDPTVRIGGRVVMGETFATIGLNRTDDTTKITSFRVEANLATLDTGRLYVVPPASTNSALRVDGATGHTGNLLRLTLNGTDKLTVDVDGNTTIAGRIKAANIAAGTVAITPSAANTPTSVTVSGLNVQGTYLRAFTGIANPAPGYTASTNGVTGTGYSNLTSTGMTVWATRQNTTAITVSWLIIGMDTA